MMMTRPMMGIVSNPKLYEGLNVVYKPSKMLCLSQPIRNFLHIPSLQSGHEAEGSQVQIIFCKKCLMKTLKAASISAVFLDHLFLDHSCVRFSSIGKILWQGKV